MNVKTSDRKRNLARSLLSALSLVVAGGASVACSGDDKPGATPSAGSGGQGAGAAPASGNGGGSNGGTSGSGGSSENGGTKATSGGNGGSSGATSGGPNGAAGEDETGAKGGTSGKGGSSSGTGGTAPSHPVDVGCDLPDAAFCDTFSKASPGGRAGDLDDAHWSVSRLGFGCAYAFAFPESPINLCGVWKTVEPGGPDSQFCLNENDEPRWAEGFDDNTDFNYLSARIRQPFDFKDRTGIVEWSADARTAGSHGWWTETWITNEAVPGPNLHNPDQLVTSRDAVAVTFDLNCGVPAAGLGTAGAGLVGVTRIMVTHDYVTRDMYDPFSGPMANQRCVKTEQGTMNKFQIHVSADRIEVFASNAGSDELVQIAEADIELPFERGFVHFSHVHYNAHKADVTTFQSYQWAKIAFDGPVLPFPRAYELPDPLTKVHSDCLDKDAFRIAYQVTDKAIFDIGEGPSMPRTMTFTDVDPSDGVSARINFNTTYVAAGDVLKFRLNGNGWREYTVPAINTFWARQGFSVPIPIEDLAPGDNTVEFATNSNPGISVPANSMHIANIDLEIEVE